MAVYCFAQQLSFSRASACYRDFALLCMIACVHVITVVSYGRYFCSSSACKMVKYAELMLSEYSTCSVCSSNLRNPACTSVLKPALYLYCMHHICSQQLPVLSLLSCCCWARHWHKAIWVGLRAVERQHRRCSHGRQLSSRER